MKLVLESLEQLYDRERSSISPYLYMELLNEGIQFKNPKDAVTKAVKILPNLTKNKRINLLALLFMLNVGTIHHLNKDKEEDLKDNKVISKLADNPSPSTGDIWNAFDMMGLPPHKETPRLLQVSNDFIEDLDTIKPNRFALDKIDQYNQYDDDIIAAVDSLISRGEKPNADLIKAIMLIETGMKPSKNELGFEGFPQTKTKFIKSINKRYGTNFTMKDMYDANKAAQFIHYYVDAVSKSKYVKDTTDIVIAYNWGIGNLGKYKRGEKKLPDQSKDYAKMMKAMQKHFPGS